MFPLHLLPQLSPTAAKLYLTLLALADFTNKPRPAVHASLATLSTAAALAPRTCSHALAQLAKLRLIQRSRHRYHAPGPLYLLPFPPAPSLHSDAPITSASLHADAPRTPSLHVNAPIHSTSSHSHAPIPTKTPTPASKKPSLHPDAPLLNQPARPTVPILPDIYPPFPVTPAETPAFLAQVAKLPLPDQHALIENFDAILKSWNPQ